MPLPFDVTVTIPFPAEPFWAQRASRPFLDFLVSDGSLRRAAATPAAPVPPSEAAALTAGPASPFRRGARLATRTQTYIPASADVPDALRAVLGEELFGLDDAQVWEAAPPPSLAAAGEPASPSAKPDHRHALENAPVGTPKEWKRSVRRVVSSEKPLLRQLLVRLWAAPPTMAQPLLW